MSKDWHGNCWKLDTMKRNTTSPSFEVYAARRSAVIDRTDGWDDWALEFARVERRDLEDAGRSPMPSPIALARLLNA